MSLRGKVDGGRTSGVELIGTIVIGTIVIGIALLVGSVVGHAQEPEVVFRTGTRLVELSVAVLDGKGKPVSGLTREDFVIYADGSPRPIAFLQFDGAAAVRRELRPLPPNVFTNRPEFLPASARNVTAIVLDSLNSSLADDFRTREQLVRTLQSMPSDSRVALYHLGNQLRVLHDFTGDMASLQRTLLTLKVARRANAEDDQIALEADAQKSSDSLQLSGSNSGSAQDRRSQDLWQEQLDRALAVERWVADRTRAERTETAFNSMMVLADHLKSVPGRKSLIWAGGGLPLLQVYGHLAPGPHNELRSNTRFIQAASRRLAQANVLLYYYDTRGVIVRPIEGVSQEEWIKSDATLGTTWLANLTGGRFVQATNDIATAFERVAEDLKGSYTLSFYAEENPKSNWVPLKVEVRGGRFRAMHRDGYSVGDTPEAPQGAGPSTADPEAELRRLAMRNPVGSSSILMNARCEPAAGESQGTLQLLLQIDAETLTLQRAAGSRTGAMDVIVADVTPEGRVFTHEQLAELTISDSEWTQTLQKGVLYQRIWKPHREATRVRVLVWDRTTGQHGTLDIPLSDAAGK